MRSSFSILAAILVLAGQAKAFNTYIGCLDITFIPQQDRIIIPASSLATPDGTGCASACESSTAVSKYGYSSWSDNTLCQCLSYGGSTGAQADFSDARAWRTALADGTCAPADAEVFRLSSAWQSGAQRCLSQYSNIGPTRPLTRVTTVGACQRYCQRNLVMLMTPLSNGEFSCRCLSGVGNPTGTTCSRDIVFQYTRSAEATAAAGGSGAYRRSLKETAKRQLAARMKHAYCPDGLIACKVAGSTEGYECMDTKYELESCGGCIIGEFGSSNSTLGADCTRKAGVPMGATSCLDGKCVAFACNRGYTLQRGACVKK